MNVSNMTHLGSASLPVAKATGVPENSSPAANGNALPGIGQIGVRSEVQPLSDVAPQQDIPTSQPIPKELDHLVEQANVVLESRFSDLKFTVAQGTDINVVRVEDKETGELIRQFPSEAMVAIARSLDEFQRGMMLEEKV